MKLGIARLAEFVVMGAAIRCVSFKRATGLPALQWIRAGHGQVVGQHHVRVPRPDVEALFTMVQAAIDQAPAGPERRVLLTRRRVLRAAHARLVLGAELP